MSYVRIVDVVTQIARSFNANAHHVYKEHDVSDEARASNGEWTSSGDSGGGKSTNDAKVRSLLETHLSKSASILHEYMPEGATKSGLQGAYFAIRKTFNSSKYSELLRSSLNAPQLNGIRVYTGNAHATINKALRDNSSAGSGTAYTIATARTGVEKMSAPKDFVTTRSLGYVSAITLSSYIRDSRGRPTPVEKIVPGAIISDKGFMSTSIDGMKFIGDSIDENGPFEEGLKLSAQAHSARVSMIITVPKGTPGAYVKSISHVPPESEFLMPPGTKLLATKVETKPASGFVNGQKVRIYATVVPEKDAKIIAASNSAASIAQQVRVSSSPQTTSASEQPSSKPAAPAVDTSGLKFASLKATSLAANDVINFGTHGLIRVSSVSPDSHPNYLKVSGTRLSDGKKVTFNPSINKPYKISKAQ